MFPSLKLKCRQCLNIMRLANYFEFSKESMMILFSFRTWTAERTCNFAFQIRFSQSFPSSFRFRRACFQSWIHPRGQAMTFPLICSIPKHVSYKSHFCKRAVVVQIDFRQMVFFLSAKSFWSKFIIPSQVCWAIHNQKTKHQSPINRTVSR